MFNSKNIPIMSSAQEFESSTKASNFSVHEYIQVPISCKLFFNTLNGFILVIEGRVLLRGDGMIHDVLLPPDHYRVSIDCVIDGCCDYMLPYPTDGSRCLVDLIGVPIKWPVSLVQPIQ